MIKSFTHKGLERFFRTGSTSGIQPKHAARLQVQLTVLNVASRPADINAPGWNLHPLKGHELKRHWSIVVNGNWRLTFRFEDNDVVLVNYQDYH